jgi:hypothetical protein
MDNPFEAFELLADRLSEKVAEIGLEQITFQPMIDKRTGQRFIQAMFVLETPLDVAPALPAEESSGDPELDAILGGIMEATTEAETARAEEERQALHDLQEAKMAELMAERAKRAQEMSERLKDPDKGFLDD